MYYGYRCYNKDAMPIGWLYTFNNDTEYAWTNKNLDWCKRWKTEKGANKNFVLYNNRWQFKSSGGYLKIEVMPDIEEPESAESRASKLLEEWGENVIEPPPNNGANSQTLSFSHSPEIIQLLEEMFKSQPYMTPEQQTIAEDFTSMVETEYALCVKEIKRANSTIVLSAPTELGEEDNKNLDFANREIDYICKYWQLRLGNLVEFIETKNHHLNKELAKKYLKHE